MIISVTFAAVNDPDDGGDFNKEQLKEEKREKKTFGYERRRSDERPHNGIVYRADDDFNLIMSTIVGDEPARRQFNYIFRLRQRDRRWAWWVVGGGRRAGAGGRGAGGRTSLSFISLITTSLLY